MLESTDNTLESTANIPESTDTIPESTANMVFVPGNMVELIRSTLELTANTRESKDNTLESPHNIPESSDDIHALARNSLVRSVKRITWGGVSDRRFPRRLPCIVPVKVRSFRGKSPRRSKPISSPAAPDYVANRPGFPFHFSTDLDPP